MKYPAKVREMLKNQIQETLIAKYNDYQEELKKGDSDYNKLNHTRVNQLYCKLIGAKDLAIQLGFGIISPLNGGTEWKVI